MSSSTKTPILTSNAPKPIPGMYSQAIVAPANKNIGTVYCSGQIATDPETGKLVEGDIQARTHQIIKNLQNVLEAAGSSLEHVVKVNIFIVDMEDFGKVNEVYKGYFGDVMPCRTCVAVKQLPLGTDVEIEAVGVIPA